MIILVKDDWSITCYDSDINILWETSVAPRAADHGKVLKYFKIDQVSIRIYPLDIREGESSRNETQSGLILIGGSMALTKDISLLSETIQYETGIDMSENANAEHPFMKARSKLEHFSVFALSGTDGHILWSHDGLGAPSEQLSRSLPQYAFSLDIRDLMSNAHHAPGVNDWTIFRQSLINELPHTWLGPEDSSMRIAHFMRRHMGAGASSQNAKKKVLPTDKKKDGQIKGDRKSVGISKKLHLLREVHNTAPAEHRAGDASLPHSASEHIENPNVVVLHSKGGLEVLSLRSGRAVTSLALSQTKTYADLDGDGVVDCIAVLPDEQSIGRHQNEHLNHPHLVASAAAIAAGASLLSNFQHLRHCSVVVTSGLPPQAQLFNGSLCHDLGSGLAALNARIPPKIRYAAPLVLHKPSPGSASKESLDHDLIIAINTGLVSSYSSSGTLHWQVKGTPTWSFGFSPSTGADGSEGAETRDAAVLAFDSDAVRAAEAGTHNSMFANILIAGETSLQLISREGDFLSAAEIPTPPVSKPVIADFDNDGVTDITVVTEDAILGYHVTIEKATNGLLVAVILMALFAAIVFVSSIQSVSVGTDEVPSSAPLGRVGKTSTSSLLRVFRSTDEHLD